LIVFFSQKSRENGVCDYLSQCTTNDYNDRELSILYNIMVMHKHNTTTKKKWKHITCEERIEIYRMMKEWCRDIWQILNRHHITIIRTLITTKLATTAIYTRNKSGVLFSIAQTAYCIQNPCTDHSERPIMEWNMSTGFPGFAEWREMPHKSLGKEPTHHA